MPSLTLRSLRVLALASLGSLPSACDDLEEDVADEEDVVYRDAYKCVEYQTELDTIRYERELMITNKNVVDDPCRTQWKPETPPGCDAAREGHWTAWYLFDQMRGNSSTEELVHRFMETFDSQKVINSFALQKREGARNLLNDWRKASGCVVPDPNNPLIPAKIDWDTVWWDKGVQKTGQCPLKKEKAPFRLLAIVNRMDLRSGTGTGGYGGNSGEAGEGRLISSSIRTSPSGRCASIA